ncbi:transcriptional regulator [Candidatus Methylomirabilis lanthanidiphila]|uniref:Probable transcriptional regulatory protein MELA_02954 n=1 Tax=Candidatus Methylomirabilis lanthanidiphila TaxID=2211376 RepID=A0A564ZMI8_9BACT|nr:YebC/PmpR family DNA-binding transcriptional regulator [Candidatus Methylomirabilis lanthanidiphila]VUZ86550.1 transcriptional regulator [Candidatus Methylomirabilis lanthanidiphila]
MSGHSKWAGIKHKKAKVDAQRGRTFTKIIREITVAARVGGGDPDGNPRLRLAIDKAKAVNMPQDNIQRAIQKGTGELPGTSYEEYIYEGYGPGGVAVLLEIVTDNKNRTAPEIRKAFAKYGGNLGESGCVAWMFEKKGLIQVEAAAADEDRLLGIVLEAGAEDVRRSDDIFEVITAPKDLERVKESLTKEKIQIAEGEVTMLPQNTVKLEGKQAQQMLQLMETLEEHDDVQNAYANFDIPEEIMAAVTS